MGVREVGIRAVASGSLDKSVNGRPREFWGRGRAATCGPNSEAPGWAPAQIPRVCTNPVQWPAGIPGQDIVTNPQAGLDTICGAIQSAAVALQPMITMTRANRRSRAGSAGMERGVVIMIYRFIYDIFYTGSIRKQHGGKSGLRGMTKPQLCARPVGRRVVLPGNDVERLRGVSAGLFESA